MLEIVEAPNNSNTNNPIKLFLAGGISNCPNWQKDIINQLLNPTRSHIVPILNNVTVYNPRRENFSIYDPELNREQITWEYEKLRNCNLLAFWFSSGSVNPIGLFEYGKHGLSQATELIVGIDPEYSRKVDVEIQTSLAKPNQKIVYSLTDFYNQIVSSTFDMLQQMKIQIYEK